MVSRHMLRQHTPAASNALQLPQNPSSHQIRPIALEEKTQTEREDSKAREKRYVEERFPRGHTVVVTEPERILLKGRKDVVDDEERVAELVQMRKSGVGSLSATGRVYKEGGADWKEAKPIQRN